jgi:nucleotide-binding universal stress UspA family protein
MDPANLGEGTAVMTTRTQSILVGVDESAESALAVDWAAVEAADTGAALTICHVAPFEPPFDRRIPDADDELLALSRQLIRRAAAAAHQVAPDLPIVELTLAGSASYELVAQSASARLLVVGHRGVGAFRGLLLESVGTQLAAHAHCPVVVVRRNSPVQPLDAVVTVGVDRSAPEPALEVAFDYASRHHYPITAVHAYQLPPPEPSSYPAAWQLTKRAATELATEFLRDAVSPWTAKYPDVHADLLATNALPADALIDESARSKLVVVGSHGHGRFTGLLLGSVSQHVLRHAECPVAVVR